MNCKFFLMAIAGLVGVSSAAKAPTHHSLRAESMGGAHIAVVDDKEALYYNYAGLSQINRLGNYELRPETGYYPRNWVGDLRLNIGGAGPFASFFSTYNDVKKLQKVYKKVTEIANENRLSRTKVLLDTLDSRPDLASILNSYDHKLLEMRVKMDAEMAFHGFGAALWIDGSIAPYLDEGIILPYIAADTFYVDAVAQAGGSYNINDRLSVGGGFKIAKRSKLEAVSVDVSNYSTLKDTLSDRFDNATDDFFDSKTFSFGIDLGVLYQLTREVRLGASLRDIYFKSLAGDDITPNFSVGVNYSPRFMNKNHAFFGRKFNIACDFVDMFNTDKNYKFFTHLNFGFELEQNLLALSNYINEARFVALRLAAGFRGGYPSAGVSLEVLKFFTFELATWGEERGYYTGQDEERVYMAEFSIGF